jgi:hypothetical protein
MIRNRLDRIAAAEDRQPGVGRRISLFGRGRGRSIYPKSAPWPKREEVLFAHEQCVRVCGDRIRYLKLLERGAGLFV